MAMTMESVGVERVHGIPRCVIHVAAEPSVELDARFGHAPALAFGLLALLSGESREEGVERTRIPVEPMELAVAPFDEAGALQGLEVVLAREQHVPGGELLRSGRSPWPRWISAADNGVPVGDGRSEQQARALDRRERDGRQQFRVVVETMLGIGIRPGEVEHELAARADWALRVNSGRAAEHPARAESSMQRTCSQALQPVRGVVQPDCSRAIRNSCLRKGCPAKPPAAAGPALPSVAR